MASGLPVFVSTQCGCAESLVADGINGRTFDPMSTDEIYRIIEEIDEMDQEQLEKMGKKSEEIISHWDLDRFCSGAYEAALFAKNHPRPKTGLLSGIAAKFWKGRYRPI